MSNQSIAFALGGLGGFNAHGVGFLQAALDDGVQPDLISCTSGQIYWTWRYLLQKSGEADPLTGKPVSMVRELSQEIDKSNVLPKSLSWLDAPVMALTGDPGIFSPAIKEYWFNLLRPYVTTDIEAFWKGMGEEMIDRLLPAQVFVPERPQALIESIGMRFATEGKIGLMFNAFDAPKGEEILYINQRALELLEAKKPGKYADGVLHNDTRVKVLEPSDPDGVREAVDAALWLYLYGFRDRDGCERTLVDGAYHRQFIIRELAPVAERIYSVRPQSVEWKAQMPTNSLQVMNFVTQLWFNASYSGETAQIGLINELLGKGHLKPGRPYSAIDLVPVEYESRIRIYDYFVEREAVYRDAYTNSRRIFAEEADTGVAA